MADPSATTPADSDLLPTDGASSEQKEFGAPPTRVVSRQPIVVQESIESLSASLSDRIEFLAQELRARWRAGRRIKIEAFGEMFDGVARNEEQLLDLIYHEILIREEFSDAVSLEEYVARFPQLSVRLERLFAVHGVLADDDWGQELNVALGGDHSEFRSAPQPSDDLGSTPADTAFVPNMAGAEGARRSRVARTVEAPPGYELFEEIGRGGMAVVFRARQTVLNRIVAMKMLLGGKIASTETIARLQQEARAVAQLQHPGIVQIHEVGEHLGQPYLCLEYLAGGTLHNWLRGRPLAANEAARIIEQLAGTIAFAHERGIIHRDLKPANILLTESPSESQYSSTALSSRSSQSSTSSLDIVPIKIGDFGLARMSDGNSDLTATGQILGTPSYMAPEQATSQPDALGPGLDIYSLGAVLYELLTGRPPFRGATLLETLEQVRNDDPVPPRHLQPRTPRDIETICLKCLEKSPSRRYGTARDLAADLRCFINGESISARPAGTLERCRKIIRKNPVIAGLICLMVVMMVLGNAAILREARRANENEQTAIADSRRAKLALEVADTERENALASAAVAESERRAANEERGRALAAQTQAEVSFDRTLKTINSLAELGASLQHLPGQQFASRRLLDTTLSLYDELAGDSSDNPEVRRRLIITLIGAGEVHRAIHALERSEKLLQQATTLVDKELQLTPRDAELQERSARASMALGTIYRNSGRWTESLTTFQRMTDALDVALEVRPNEPKFINSKSISLVNQGLALRHLEQFDQALRCYEQAIALARTLNTEPSSDEHYQSTLGHGLHHYSQLLRHVGRTREADVAADESLTVRERVLAAYPNSPVTRVNMVLSWLAQAELDRAGGKFDASISKLIQADELLRMVVLWYAEIYDNHTLMLDVLRKQLDVCIEADRAELGFAASKRVTEQLIFSVPRFPKDKVLHRLSADWAFFHGELCWERGETAGAEFAHTRAIESFRVLRTSDPKLSKDDLEIENDFSWCVANTPFPKLQSVTLALGCMGRVYKHEPKNPHYLRTLGLAMYRCSQFTEARDILSKAVELILHPTEQGAVSVESLSDDARRDLALCRMILAMTQWQLGDHTQARQTFQLVEPPAKTFTRHRPELQRFHKEAADLIPPK